MKAAAMLRGARHGSGISQRELGRRSGVAQPSISRIERGVVSPSVDTLDRLLGACGMEMEAVGRLGVGVDRSVICEWLKMTPAERARRAALEWNRTHAFRRVADGSR